MKLKKNLKLKRYKIFLKIRIYLSYQKPIFKFAVKPLMALYVFPNLKQFPQSVLAEELQYINV